LRLSTSMLSSNFTSSTSLQRKAHLSFQSMLMLGPKIIPSVSNNGLPWATQMVCLYVLHDFLLLSGKSSWCCPLQMCYLFRHICQASHVNTSFGVIDEVWLNILGHYVCMPFATTAFGPTSGTGRPAPSAGQLSRSNLLETNCWSRHWLSISRDLDFGLKPALVAMTGRGSYLGSLSKRGASWMIYVVSFLIYPMNIASSQELHHKPALST
jgi:hypothetical protein